MINLIHNKVPEDMMEVAIGAKRLSDAKSLGPWIHQYNLYVKCRNIGMRFGPEELTVEQVEMFCVIQEIFDENQKKDNNHG